MEEVVFITYKGLNANLHLWQHKYKTVINTKTLYPHILFYFRPYEDSRGVYDVKEALVIWKYPLFPFLLTLLWEQGDLTLEK